MAVRTDIGILGEGFEIVGGEITILRSIVCYEDFVVCHKDEVVYY